MLFNKHRIHPAYQENFPARTWQKEGGRWNGHSDDMSFHASNEALAFLSISPHFLPSPPLEMH